MKHIAILFIVSTLFVLGGCFQKQEEVVTPEAPAAEVQTPVEAEEIQEESEEDSVENTSSEETSEENEDQNAEEVNEDSNSEEATEEQKVVDEGMSEIEEALADEVINEIFGDVQ